MLPWWRGPAPQIRQLRVVPAEGERRAISQSAYPIFSVLDEYVFRHNRRGNPHAAFQTLLRLSTHHQPSSYRQIIDHAA